MRYFSLLTIVIAFSCSSAQQNEIKMSSYHTDYMPLNTKLIASTQGKGKYLILSIAPNSLCNTIYIEQQDNRRFKEYIIESLEQNRWCKIHQSTIQSNKIRLDFSPRHFQKVRLHIKRSDELPHITHFSLCYRE